APAEFTLKVKLEGAGSGEVTSSPAGIACTTGTCEAKFAEGKLVKLTGAPAANTEPVVWSGCASVNGANECEVTMAAAKSVTATFTRKTPLLSVDLAGSGSGTVTSAPAGISCGGECSKAFEYGALVKLKGTPGAGSKAVLWSGCDAVNGANECEVTMTAAKGVTASFAALGLNSLIVQPAGSGSGTVTSNPAGINCGGECSHDYSEGTLVKLTGTPSGESKAVVWGGCDTVAAGVCEVTMSAAKNVTATFDKQQFALKVKLEGGGSGEVTSNPAGISCTAGTCEALFNSGQLVKLTAAPKAGSTFSGWGGACSGTGSCEVTMSAAKEVTATFAPAAAEQRSLTVEKGGTGSGTITSSPAGVNCGPTCQASFALGTEVTLTAVSAAGSKPVVWQGCASNPTPTQCKVMLDVARTVTATFSPEEDQTLSVTKKGTGAEAGTVTSAPAGISCGPTCVHEYPEGTAVKLAGVAGPSGVAVAWSGCDTVNGANECEVTMSAAKSVTASFENEERQLTVSKAGAGVGFVASAPAGIGCGATCRGKFEIGSIVVLTGTAGSATSDVVWSGCDSIVGANRCQVELTADTTVTATFASTAGPPPVVPEEPAPEEPITKKKKTPRQKALAKCKKLKGKAKTRCVRKANRKAGRKSIRDSGNRGHR
ncbi:MAG TPA: hypothetical protein VMT37_01450, partial [Solirubrobacterales bacterium]|nr:hypothetical protein [Solirubrobacterales bacterium]